jgi:hypothetical protein
MNGVNGAISSVTVRRHSCRVDRAPVSPFQNLRRFRRTYQLDRSSTKEDRARPAACVSNLSNAAVTSRIVRAASERAHRSSELSSDESGESAPGCQPAVRPYKDWKLAVFQ